MSCLQFLLYGSPLKVDLLCALQIIKCFDMIDQGFFKFAFFLRETIIFRVMIIVLVLRYHILNIYVDRDTVGFWQVVVLFIGFIMRLEMGLAKL